MWEPFPILNRLKPVTFNRHILHADYPLVMETLPPIKGEEFPALTKHKAHEP